MAEQTDGQGAASGNRDARGGRVIAYMTFLYRRSRTDLEILCRQVQVSSRILDLSLATGNSDASAVLGYNVWSCLSGAQGLDSPRECLAESGGR
jgi:hypothetical protein